MASLETMDRFRLDEREVTELFTIVTFVSDVRLSDGTLWECEEQAILAELTKLKLKATIDMLSAN